jgi:hypothetical protein
MLLCNTKYNEQTMGDPWIQKQIIRIMKLQHIVKQFTDYTLYE